MEFERKNYIVADDTGLAREEVKFIEAMANDEPAPQGTSNALYTLRAKTGAANMGSLFLHLLKTGVIKSLCVTLALGCCLGTDNALRLVRTGTARAGTCTRVYN